MSRRDDFTYAYRLLQADLQQLAGRWNARAPRPTIAAIVEGAEAHVAAMLRGVELDRYDRLPPESRVIVHTAYLHLLAIAGALAAAHEDGWAAPIDLATAYESVVDVLEAIAPAVAPADLQIRRIALDEPEAPA